MYPGKSGTIAFFPRFLLLTCHSPGVLLGTVLAHCQLIELNGFFLTSVNRGSMLILDQSGSFCPQCSAGLGGASTTQRGEEGDSHASDSSGVKISCPLLLAV